jgi:hypothetical protein
VRSATGTTVEHQKSNVSGFRAGLSFTRKALHSTAVFSGATRIPKASNLINLI